MVEVLRGVIFVYLKNPLQNSHSSYFFDTLTDFSALWHEMKKAELVVSPGSVGKASSGF